MVGAAVPRSFPRSNQQIEAWVWLTVHVYVIACLVGAGDLSPFKQLDALCSLQIILAPALLIYLLTTHKGSKRWGLFSVAAAFLLVIAAALIHPSSSPSSQDRFALAVLRMLFESMFIPSIIVAELIVWNVFLFAAMLKGGQLARGVLLLLLSLVLAGLTFSPRDWMWREIPWALYFTAMDKFDGPKEEAKSSAAVRQLRSVPDVVGQIGGESCSTELYYVRGRFSALALSLQMAKLLHFPPRDQFDPPLAIVQYAVNFAPAYVLAYDCY